MATTHVGKSPATRLASGAAILAAARTVDTRLIKDRLAAFERTHQRYADAHAKVQKSEAELEQVQGQFRTDQQTVVDALGRALVADGQPLKNPFAAFGDTTMGQLLHMRPADAVKRLPELIAALRRGKIAGKATLQALPNAEKVAGKLPQTLARIEALAAEARDGRSSRDAVGQAWDAAFAALKRAARAAADDGATTLYATLFDQLTRTNGKNHKPAPAPAPAAPSVTPTPAPAPDPAANTTPPAAPQAAS